MKKMPYLSRKNSKKHKNHKKQSASKEVASKEGKDKSSKANKANKKSEKKNNAHVGKTESKKSMCNGRNKPKKSNEPSTSKAHNVPIIHTKRSKCATHASNGSSVKVAEVNNKAKAATKPNVTATASLSATTIATSAITAAATSKRSENPIAAATSNSAPVKAKAKSKSKAKAKTKTVAKKGPTWLKLSNTAISNTETLTTCQPTTEENISICRPGTLYSDVLFGAGTSCAVKVKNLVTRCTAKPTTSSNPKKQTKSLYKRSGACNDTSEDSDVEINPDAFPDLHEIKGKSVSSTPRSESTRRTTSNRNSTNSTSANGKCLNTNSPPTSVNNDQPEKTQLSDSSNSQNKTIDTSAYGIYLEEHFPQLSSTVGSGSSGNRSSASHRRKSRNNSITSSNVTYNNSASADVSTLSSFAEHSEISTAKVDALTVATSTEATDNDTEDYHDVGAIGAGVPATYTEGQTMVTIANNGLKANGIPNTLNESHTNRAANTAKIPKRLPIHISAFNFLEIDVSCGGFPKFLYQFNDEHYLRFEKMGLLGLKLALGNCPQQGKFKL